METPAHQRYLRKPFIGASHYWAQAACAAIDSASRVLDIGSGSGVMGEALRERGFKEVCAVEPDPAARSTTSHLYTQIADSPQAFVGRQFDVILLLDVLEHMADPERFMRELLPLMAPGAMVLISVPNVAHWSVRLPLLCGQFTYHSRGILDRTHLRFFTRKTLRSFVRELPELTIISEAVSIPPVEFVLPAVIWNTSWFRVLTTLHHRCAQLLPGLLGYQLLTVASIRK